MQFSTIFALSLAVMASASPAAPLEQRTTPTTPAEAQTSCSAINNQYIAQCCSTKNTSGGIIGGLIGSLTILQGSCGVVSGVLGQSLCSNNQKVACCQSTTTQNGGLIQLAVPNICPNIL